MIFAQPGMLPPENASLATMDLLFKMDNVLSTLIPQLFLKVTFSAKLGQEKSVLPAQKEVSSMKMASVLPSVLTAIPLIEPVVTALVASLAMIS